MVFDQYASVQFMDDLRYVPELSVTSDEIYIKYNEIFDKHWNDDNVGVSVLGFTPEDDEVEYRNDLCNMLFDLCKEEHRPAPRHTSKS